MRNTLRALSLLLALPSLALPSVALAQAPDAAAPAASPVTLEDAIHAARRFNRDIKAAREHLVQVDADIDRAWAALLPTVVAQGKYTHNNIEAKLDTSAFTGFVKPFGDAIQDLYTQTGKVPSATVLQELQALQAASSQSSGPIIIQKGEQLDFVAQASVPLIVPWAYAGIRAARRAYASQAKGYEAQESGLLLQVAAAFYGAAGLDEVVQARKHAIEVANRTLHDAEVRFQAGVVNRVEVARARVSVVQAEQSLLESTAQAASAYRALRTLTGLEGPIKVVAPEEPGGVERPVRALIDDAYQLRPDLAAYSKAIEAADANKLSVNLRWLPTLSGFGLFRAFNYKGFYPDYFAWSVGLQLDWILYDGGQRQAGAKQAASAARETQLKLDQARAQVADDVTNLRKDIEVRRQGLAAAREQRKLAEETLELVRVQREAGTATQLDLLTAQDLLIMTELNVARLRFDLGLSNLQLQRATGQFPSNIQ